MDLQPLLLDLLTPGEIEFDVKSQKIIGKFAGIVLNKFNIHLLSNKLSTRNRVLSIN